ncbi:CPBP family intramembrane metalloprotease [Flavobacteriales bacterium]|nr:CPBP family intramembrane metalloprotease [Flavobacteriales bacterium]MDB9702257.1 CPBP family intramembrane metalloprotease [Flavobacteriales bacterium]MDC1370974.1 CPBP family intramembrane metalloprotease [Flavobacteriales bacterium]
MIKKEKLNFGEKKLVTPTKTLLAFAIKLGAIALGSFLFLFFYDSDSLFNVISTKPMLWLGYSLIYVLLSVIPQEIIYRYFFLKRYRTLFKNKLVMVLVNASLFSLAHIWFNSWIVLAFTFVGGILFFYTYRKNSLALASNFRTFLVRNMVVYCWVWRIIQDGCLVHP